MARGPAAARPAQVAGHSGLSANLQLANIKSENKPEELLI